MPLRITFFIFLLSIAINAFASSRVLTVEDADIVIDTHPANGEYLIIWLPSEAGPQPIDIKIANQLANLRIEVWRIDLVDAHFLPVAPSSVDLIPAIDIAEIIDLALQQTGKKIVVVTSGRGVIPVLRGYRNWQQKKPATSEFVGIILLSPKFFIETPHPGVKGEIMPIVESSNAPVFIIQPKLSPWFWKLKRTISALEVGGSDVYVRVLSNVRDRFYFRPDATSEENLLTDMLPGMIKNSILMLNALPKQARTVAPLSMQPPKVKAGKKERYLQIYRGDPSPPHLNLPNLHDQVVDLNDFRGKVVLINFWATWCPPCVHEMPSMQRLKDKMKNEPFEILGVNMAEEKSTVVDFVNTKVSVGFPILFDFDGQVLKRWNVFAFPTSYVIDKRGKIRYALFGSIEWDSEEIFNAINKLISEF